MTPRRWRSAPCPSGAGRAAATLLATLLATLATSGGAPALAAQDADTVPWTGMHEVEVRWQNARQSPALTRFAESMAQLRFEGLRDPAMTAGVDGGRSWAVRTGRERRRGALRIGADGELVEAWIEPPTFGDRYDFSRPHRNSTLWLAARTLAADGALVLDDSRLWDIAPLELPSLRPGATVRDTLVFRAERFGFVQSLDGPRVATLLRDTTVAGRRLWIGRDSARVQYRERVLHWRRSLDTLVVVERQVTGTLRGRFLYDPALGLYRERSDTLVARGRATLLHPDGREYGSPASYERRTTWTLRSPEEQRVWEEERRREERRNSFSIVRLPRTPLEARVAGGDTAVADSLLDAWQRATPDERGEIDRALMFAPRGHRDRLDSLRSAAWGWIGRIGEMTSRVWAGPPVDSAEMADYLTLLRDPGLAFEYGLDPDPAYENLAGGLVMHPPTLGAPARKTSCTPAACRLVAAELDAAEPRLRQVALVARFVLEPERLVDSLLSRPDTASHLLHDAVLLARGVGATWESAEQRPIPDEGAGWREWRGWTGVDQGMSADTWGGRIPLVRVQDTHRYAIRLTERLTGRDIGQELAAAADTARGDTARAVFRALGLQLGSIRPTVEGVVAGLRSPDPTERELAFAGLYQLRDDRRPADPAVARELVGQLLAQVLGGDSLWAAAPDAHPPRPLRQSADADSAGRVYLASQNVPDSIRAAWEGRDAVTVLTREEWNRQPPRMPGTLLVVGEVRILGPLAWISLDRWVRQARAPDEGPQAWASGEEFLLLRTGDGWMVLTVGGWVT